MSLFWQYADWTQDSRAGELCEQSFLGLHLRVSRFLMSLSPHILATFISDMAEEKHTDGKDVFETYEDFWPHYVSEHSNSKTR